MNNLYEWLYENYAKPRLSNAQPSPVCLAQSQEWQAAAEKLSRHDRLLSYDLMDTLRNEWGTLAFACGIQLGLFLAADPFAKGE